MSSEFRYVFCMLPAGEILADCGIIASVSEIRYL